MVRICLCFPLILVLALIFATPVETPSRLSEDPPSQLSAPTEHATLFHRFRERRESRPRIFNGRLRGGICRNCG